MTYIIVTLIPLILLCRLAIILSTSGQWRRFPLFTLYTFYAVADLIHLLVRLLHGMQIRATPLWLVTEAIFAFIGLLATYEAFAVVFEPFYNVVWLRRTLPIILTAIGLLAMTKVIYNPPRDADRLGIIILNGEIVVRYLQAAIFTAFFIMARLLRIQPMKRGAAVLDGFGLIAVGILVASMLRSEFGTSINFLFQYLPSVTYIVAVVIWLAGFSAPEEKLNGAGHSALQRMLEELKKYVGIRKGLGYKQ